MNPKVKFAECDKCPYKAHVAVKSTIQDKAEVTLVIDAPSNTDVVENQLLDNSPVIEYIDRPYIATSVIACKPDSNERNLEIAIKCCAPRLKYILDNLSTERIISFGASSTKAVSEHFGKLLDTDKITLLRGKEIITTPTLLQKEKKIYPMFAPGYIYRNPSALDQWKNDLSVALGDVERENILVTMPTPKIIDLNDLNNYWPLLNGRLLAFDLETEYLEYFNREGKPKAKILCVALATLSDVFIVEWKEEQATPENLEILGRILSDNETIGHNGKFDILHLWSNGVDKARLKYDSMLAHHIINEIGPHGLKPLATQYFGIGDYDKELEVHLNKIKEHVNYGTIPKPVLYKYAGIDVWVTLNLYMLLARQLKQEQLWNTFIFVMEENDVITKMQFNGIQVDAPYLDNVGRNLEKAAIEKKKELAELCGTPDLNPSSPQQIAHILYDVFKLKPPTGYKYKDKPRSTDSGALDSLEHPFVDALESYRSVSKLSTSYVNNIYDRLDELDRVRCDFLLHGTVTGRLSTREPALQTIPRGKDSYGQMIKSSFIAKTGHKLIIADYSQAELRVAAAMSKDEFLLDFFNNGGNDMHAAVAKRIWGDNYTKAQRSIAKIVNFAWLYGANDSVIAVQAKIPLLEATAIVTDYEKLLWRLKEWRDKQYASAKVTGYISTPMGRRQRFPIIDKSNWRNVWKSCANTPIQGGAAESTINSLIKLDKLGLSKYLVLTVHDSILLEVPNDLAEEISSTVQNTMIETGTEMFPLVAWKADVEITARWMEIPQ